MLSLGDLVLKLNHFTLLSGMLLRYFVHFYDMEIIEEEAFLFWKEDVNQEYPGKGKALFQVFTFTLCLDSLVFFSSFLL